jgi:SAM-dependent methyltransferase
VRLGRRPRDHVLTTKLTTMTDPNDATLATYQAAADRYLEASIQPPPVLLAYLDQFADLIGTGHVLELGSGPGWDAAYLEQRGLQVARTDATPAFIERLHAAGHDARLLDVRCDDFGGPYDAVLANAVLLHLKRDQFLGVLRRARRAVSHDGLLAVTLKDGDGEGWSTAKLGRPRHFTYWREPAVRRALDQAGWAIVSLDRVSGRADQWLYIIARAT